MKMEKISCPLYLLIPPKLELGMGHCHCKSCRWSSYQVKLGLSPPENHLRTISNMFFIRNHKMLPSLDTKEESYTRTKTPSKIKSAEISTGEIYCRAAAKGAWGWCSRLISAYKHRLVLTELICTRISVQNNLEVYETLIALKQKPHSRGGTQLPALCLHQTSQQHPAASSWFCPVHAQSHRSWKSWGIIWVFLKIKVLCHEAIKHHSMFWLYCRVFLNVTDLDWGGKAQTFSQNMCLPANLLWWLIKQSWFD